MRALALAWFVVACSTPQPQPAPPAQPQVPTPVPASAELERGEHKHVVDSHVHLAFYPVADQLAKHGVDAAVDLASPAWALGKKYPLRVIQSGPMLTRPGGYPLDSWGADGYGIGCKTVACIDKAIDQLAKDGAGVIKLALDGNGLDPKLANRAVIKAHARGLKVVAHALTDASAGVAADIGVDALAHTPLEALSADTLAKWRLACQRSCAVISTLAAFGGSDTAVDNLRKLRTAGLTVLYGTDLGNLRVDGPSSEEIALLERAGLDDTEVEAAMTTVPWHYWGFDSR